MSISKDLIKWKRFDKFSGITISRNGWDNQMICYPYVFRIKKDFYMLYNGNNYGRTGFGFAKMVLN